MIRGAAEAAEGGPGEVDWANFEVELNALVRKYFPHWEAKDISQLMSR
ncbi:sulfate adenylyltransferase subunit 1 [Halomonas elongata]|nr:sulfate adenylyltransferase subunit 1 [Halomonas elongata]